MKSSKKLVTVVLPQHVLSEAKAVQKKFGISTLSSLLRTALEEKSGVNLKSRKEKTRQISFRVEPETVEILTKLAKQNGRSLAEIVRVLIGNVGRISSKKLTAAATASRKKSLPAKSAKSAKPTKPLEKAGLKAAKKQMTKTVKASVKKSAPAKKAVVAKKAVSAKVPARNTKKKHR